MPVNVVLPKQHSKNVHTQLDASSSSEESSEEVETKKPMVISFPSKPATRDRRSNKFIGEKFSAKGKNINDDCECEGVGNVYTLFDGHVAQSDNIDLVKNKQLFRELGEDDDTMNANIRGRRCTDDINSPTVILNKELIIEHSYADFNHDESEVPQCCESEPIFLCSDDGCQSEDSPIIGKSEPAIVSITTTSTTDSTATIESTTETDQERSSTSTVKNESTVDANT